MRKLAYILAVPFLLLASCSTLQVHAPVPLAPVADHLACRPDVIAAMNQAWIETGNGGSGTEAGFRIDVDGKRLAVVPHEHTNEQGHLTTVISPLTIAEFHVHPLGSGGEPSTPDNNVLGDPNLGDTKVADDHLIDIYTFNNQGLFVYRWTTKKIVKLRDGYEWLTPCPHVEGTAPVAQVRAKQK